MTQQSASADEEFMVNSIGRSVPASRVPARMRLEDQTVRILIEKAVAMQAGMKAFKTGAFDDIYAFKQQLAELYGADRSGRRGGIALNSFDGLMKIEVSWADTLTFGPELSIAKELIDKCIDEWSQGANDNLKVLVNDAFSVGGKGSIRVDRVIALRRLDIPDDRWNQAMAAITDALRPEASRSYIRFYKRESAEAKWTQIALDMSGL